MNNIIQSLSLYMGGGHVMFPVLIGAAFLAGIIASLSPCSLGILPLIIGYVGGYSKEKSKRLFLQMLSFSVGLSAVLSIIGVLCALTGRAFTGFATPVLLLLFSSFIIILGLNLIGFVELQFPAFIKKMPENKNGSLFIFPFTAGAVFALVSSPCSSPILASLLAIAAISSNFLFSSALLFSFALGQCLIIIFFALFTSALKNAGKLAKYTNILIKASGILFILTGLYIIYSVFSAL